MGKGKESWGKLFLMSFMRGLTFELAYQAFAQKTRSLA